MAIERVTMIAMSLVERGAVNRGPGLKRLLLFDTLLFMSGSAAGAYERFMVSVTTFFVALALTVALADRAAANEPQGCLDSEQRRGVFASREAMPLAKAVHAVRSHVVGEIVRARLCDFGRGLVYEMIVLGPNGKVTRTIVDAVSGVVVGGK
ncbi:MAG TPA: hypothetical protein VHN11_20230 [Xanthobacteraceae bacterium]|jgi:uncharacterized membrane protein YkoI|nr:hypothetical protein [Xanthobacteraceae bacterium]